MRKTNIWFLNLLFFTGIGLGSCNQADKDSKYILSSTYKCNFLGADNKQ